MFDVDRLKTSVDLLPLAERDTALRRVASTGGGEWAGACPFCGGRDRFRVQPHVDGGGRWLCRQCTESKWQDVIAYVMRREACDFRRACELLGAVESLPTRPRHVAPPPSPAGPSSVDWQSAARSVIETCEAALWGTDGERARAWLHARGLTAETLRHWHVGYLPGGPHEWREIAGLKVHCGIVIPCEVDREIWYLKTRRASGLPKYQQVKGSRPALFGAETLRDHSVAVLCEGEFDALLLWQAVRDLAGVATLGSASGRLDVSVWAAWLLPLTRLLIAYDLDGAGGDGAAKLAGLTHRARIVTVPQLQEGDKDLTDYCKTGGNLREWLSVEIARHGHNQQASGDLRQSIPDFITQFLHETGNVIAARDGDRLAIASTPGRSVFDELAAVSEPATPEAKADYARSLAAAAIREGRYGEGWPMESAAEWLQWTERHGV